ncbi:DUF2973 domain-containing protein [Synechococcus sp. MU1625]|uniref:DUF2973 domain-containing protein n=1 Tax=Synechococcus sp. MU1625 TaxID=2508347 RepID=UPI00351D3F32
MLAVWWGARPWGASGGGTSAGLALFVPDGGRAGQAEGLALGGEPLTRPTQSTKTAVNVFSYLVGRSVLSGLFPLAYAAVLTCLLLQAFRMMRHSSASAVGAPSDRTGLKTIHPELLDENGVMTNDELWAVRFSEKDGVVFPEA